MHKWFFLWRLGLCTELGVVRVWINCNLLNFRQSLPLSPLPTHSGSRRSEVLFCTLHNSPKIINPCRRVGFGEQSNWDKCTSSLVSISLKVKSLTSNCKTFLLNTIAPDSGSRRGQILFTHGPQIIFLPSLTHVDHSGWLSSVNYAVEIDHVTM